ncbi:MAG: hypothetical protein ACRD2B_10370 [Terriglobia bacterium]
MANVGRFGDSGYNILSGPPLFNLDFGLEKSFSIGEHADITGIGTVGTVSGIERVLLGEPAPREIDFGLRLMF